MYVYHVSSPIELFIICCYFNEQIEALKRKRIALAIGWIGIIVAIVNAAFLQPLNTINSIFLLYEGFCIIGLCLFAFFVLVKDELEILNNVHFWIATILLIYWSFVFVYWGMYSHFLTTLHAYQSIMSHFIWVINILAYCGYAILFLRYRKMATHG
jgi:hypothetical protein